LNRQRRRKIERQWNKIKHGSVCTNFIERNGLFTIPYVIAFQAVKLNDDIMCVYSIGLFDSKDGSSFGESIMVCNFVNSLFRSLSSIPIGVVSEADLTVGEEVEE
jgi:hypothetical protein